MRPSQSYWQDAWRRLKRDRLALLGGTAILLILLLAVVGPWVSPYAYDTQDFMESNELPSPKHWFGTDMVDKSAADGNPPAVNAFDGKPFTAQM